MEPFFHSVVLKEERCVGCTLCLKVCPTEAIRICNGKATIIPERCIDCGYCIQICPNYAKTAITDSLESLQKYEYNIAIPSVTLFGQFKGKHSIGQILGAVKKLGFDEVCEPIFGARAICINLNRKARSRDTKVFPLINSNCPAVVRLIQIKFPSLIPNIVDIETALEITAEKAKEDVFKEKGIPKEKIGVTFISPCVARATSTKKPLGIEKSSVDEVISIKDTYGDILRNLVSKDCEELPVKSAKEDISWYYTGNQGVCLGTENYISVDGINDVMKVLEEIDMQKLENIVYVEAAACRGGCFGGPLALENSFVARAKIKDLAKNLPEREMTWEETKELLELYDNYTIRLTKPIKASNALRLDKDIGKSMDMLDKVKKIFDKLPGIDCGVCGSPSCMAFAEDIVKGYNKGRKCLVRQVKEE